MFRCTEVLVCLFSFLLNQSAAQFNKHGIALGPCPRVKPMQDFDTTKIYGGKWYLIAHYSEQYILVNKLRCMHLEFLDANPGKDLCRVSVTTNSTVYGTEEKDRLVYEKMIPDPARHAVWINDLLDTPMKSVILDTDYDTFLTWHECSHFPRDNPIIHEQHNYIQSRTAVWKNPKRDLRKAFDAYDSQGIDLKQFILHEQEDCVNLVGDSG